MARATAQSPNRIGYRDRFHSRDATMSYSQLFESKASAAGEEIVITGMRSKSGLWTRLAKVNLLRSASQAFIEQEHFEITSSGTVKWLTAPPDSGTLLTIHGEFYPTWIALDHVYAVRDTLVSKKEQATDVAGQHRNLPLHTVVKLDFLANALDE
ncbi:MAG: hypothetical protein ACYTFZ_08700 [Planctomycetota bacterium]